VLGLVSSVLSQGTGWQTSPYFHSVGCFPGFSPLVSFPYLFRVVGSILNRPTPVDLYNGRQMVGFFCCSGRKSLTIGDTGVLRCPNCHQPTWSVHWRKHGSVLTSLFFIWTSGGWVAGPFMLAVQRQYHVSVLLMFTVLICVVSAMVSDRRSVVIQSRAWIISRRRCSVQRSWWRRFRLETAKSSRYSAHDMIGPDPGQKVRTPGVPRSNWEWLILTLDPVW